jgi:hypothetical protein
MPDFSDLSCGTLPASCRPNWTDGDLRGVWHLSFSRLMGRIQLLADGAYTTSSAPSSTDPKACSSLPCGLLYRRLSAPSAAPARARELFCPFRARHRKVPGTSPSVSPILSQARQGHWSSPDSAAVAVSHRNVAYSIVAFNAIIEYSGFLSSLRCHHESDRLRRTLWANLCASAPIQEVPR